jgi:alcohol dehydrogenase class IV
VSFEFAAPPRILFGEGRVREVPELAVSIGGRALVVRGRGGRATPLLRELTGAGVETIELEVAGEPTTSLVEQAAERARQEQCELVVAMGGGSVIDAGKAVAALLTNLDPLLQYLEVVGPAKPLAHRPAPFIAIPTTAGPGAEATRNAVLLVEDHHVKVSLRSPLMLPAVAVVDPELTYTLPPNVTASTGLDALTQCIEPFVSPAANPLTDAMAREGMRRAAASLHRAFRDGHDAEARRDMAIASLCGGLALANAKLGAVHGIVAPLGGMFPIPHGVACARLLPYVVDANLRALRARAPQSPALARYDEVARIITGESTAVAEDAVSRLLGLTMELAIPALGTYGVDERAIGRISAHARDASSMKGNPIVLTDDELHAVMRAAL